MNSPLIFRTFVVLMAACQCACAGDWMTWPSTYTHDPVTGHRIEQYAAPVEPLAPNAGNLVRSGYRHYRSTIQAGQSADNLHLVTEWGRPVMPYEHWRFPYRPYGVPYQGWGPPTPSVYSNFNAGYGPAYGGQGRPHGGSPGGPGGSMGGGAAGSAAQANPALSGGAWDSSGNGPAAYGGGYGPGPGYGAGGGYGNGYGAGYGYGGGYGGFPGGYPGGYPGGASAYPLVPPFQPAPWYDGFYPSAPPLDTQSDAQFFYRPPQSLRP